MPHLGDVADTPQNPVRDPGRPSRAARDLGGGIVVDGDPENAGGRKRIAVSCSGS